MFKKIIIVSMIVGMPSLLHAQLGGLFNKVKNKTKQRADAKVDKGIDKGLDKAEGKSTGSKVDSSAKQPVPSSSPKQPVVMTTTDTTGVRSFSKFDFVSGDKVIYYDNFEGEAIAELPQGWNTSGTGEVTVLEKFPGNWLRLHNPFTYLSGNIKKFGENYTIEFDMILQLKNNGWMYPEVTVGLISTKDESPGGNKFLKESKKYAAITATFMPGEFGSSKLMLNSYSEEQEYFKGDPKPFGNLEQHYGKPVHIAIQVQKERFRMWVNEEKLFDVPKGIPVKYAMNQLIYQVGHTNYAEDQYGIYIGNIKIASGKTDTRHKLLDEGKFSTTAILFDVNAATIKPESGGVLQEIAGVLNQVKETKIIIIGHTDSDGNDAANLALSKKRAQAVKDALVNSYGVEAARIKTDGKGESMPVADNKTKESKAENRRVEFVKQ